MSQLDLTKYTEFVDQLTSTQSKDHAAYLAEIDRLHKSGCDIARIDCAVNGLMAESGEVMEVVKKLKFQGKEWNDEVLYHLKREAGDVVFYWINLCLALGMTPTEIIAMNVEKLQARYPGGSFSVFHSENRADKDI